MGTRWHRDGINQDAR